MATFYELNLEFVKKNSRHENHSLQLQNNSGYGVGRDFYQTRVEEVHIWVAGEISRIK